MDLVFAFALNNDNQFEDCHFGDSHKFAIYHQNGDKIEFSTEVENIYRNGKHGDNQKGNSIIKYLEELNVNILVSREFGRNIVMVNKHFIPVIISKESPEEVIKVLQDKLHWILDEWNSSSSDYKLFRITSSVLKLRIEKE
jgi:predicted Fe-Mo cluster-binding NifX family protein